LSQRVTPSPLPGEGEGRINEEEGEEEKIGSIRSEKEETKKELGEEGRAGGCGRKRRKMSCGKNRRRDEQ
jgi:hypothetical protein